MKYFECPNLPNKRSKGVIIDYRTDSNTVNELKNIGIDVYTTQKNNSLYEAVNGHADMQIFHMGNNRFITAPDNYEYYKQTLFDAEIIKGSKAIKNKYPDDICYNAAAIGNFLFCNARCTASEIVAEYSSSYKKILNVKQGYAKCSICIVNSNAIITADNTIYKVAVENKIDALKIESGYIELKNMNYGFIGGATGLIAPDVLAVNGDITTHVNSESIIDFCRNYGVSVYSLKKGVIEDIGSILPIF